MTEDATHSTDGTEDRPTNARLSRRATMAIAAALGAGAATGSATAQQDGDRHGDGNDGGRRGGGRRVPAASPWNDEDGDGLLEPDEEFEGLDASVIKATPAETEPDIGIVPKELITQRDRTIYVDPSGDDGGDGTEDDPVATIQEAVNRVPFVILHDIVIDIAEGEYTADKESPAVHVGPFLLKGEGNLNLVGNVDDPSSVYCDVGVNWTGFGKLEHMQVHGVHWGHLSQFAGQADVRDCIFHGSGGAAISGKNGHVFFKRCTIGEPGSDRYAVWGIQLERMYFDDCTINATEVALNVFNGDIYQLSGENVINAPETFAMSGGAIATQGTDLYVGGEKK